ncbi:MAG: hypothetical protein V3V01_11940 [Acidimicrobiales bacterium]
MTDLELIALFTASWIGAAAIWMLLDWVSRPKHSRFIVKGDRIGRGPFATHHFRRVRRAEESEETRLLLESRYGSPTLALSRKRRDRVRARHDRTHAPTTHELDQRSWIALSESDAGFGPANSTLLKSGQPAVRYNSVLETEETMMLLPGGAVIWPSITLDPFASKRLADLDDDQRRDFEEAAPPDTILGAYDDSLPTAQEVEDLREAG